ncbi:MAG TPA: hypothetical protein DHW31_02555 [Bacteroides graminisolvens]|jgi:hypothetical protein|uniref:NVEALA protein n=1 Tax=Bacteroides graminisolvens TaxID=477666 RepID=A0A3D2SFI0_9BACE|nr:hypothetical protein [Bacteroides graminisolvens]
MKKNFIKIAFVAVVAVIAGYGVYSSQKSDILSDLVLANVEALAVNENPLCPNGCVSNGDGCYCNGWYPCYQEAKW